MRRLILDHVRFSTRPGYVASRRRLFGLTEAAALACAEAGSRVHVMCLVSMGVGERAPAWQKPPA